MSSLDTSRDNGQSPIDLVHLRAMTMSDPALEREVLGLFVAQSGNIMAALTALPRDTAALAHTLKGSARAIGAFGAADAAGRVEDAARSGSDIRTPAVRDAVAELSSEIDLACAAIAKLLRKP
jgi:HPt (histidine-containing phosphotransfer) domain-containing protein